MTPNLYENFLNALFLMIKPKKRGIAKPSFVCEAAPKWPPVDEMSPNFACRDLLGFRFQKCMIGGHPEIEVRIKLVGY